MVVETDVTPVPVLFHKYKRYIKTLKNNSPMFFQYGGQFF